MVSGRTILETFDSVRTLVWKAKYKKRLARISTVVEKEISMLDSGLYGAAERHEKWTFIDCCGANPV
jgi:hypothetical protein